MAWYKAGTVATVSGSPTVTGTGTVWLTQIKPGDSFTVDKVRQYEVLTVNSDTSITLTENYVDATDSGQAYAILRNFTDTVPASLASSLLGIMTRYEGLADTVGGGGGTVGTTTATLTRGTYLTGGNFNGSTAATWAVDATSANTASKVVVRDASGNFSAGTITGALNGNALTATSATKLAIPRLINGVPFDGSANISIGGTGSGSSSSVINATSTIPAGRACGVMIPLYIYPLDIYLNTAYHALVDLIKRYRHVPTIVILNPLSGPGPSTDGNYVVAAKMLKAAGACLVGYISTAYAGNNDPTRTETAVKADIDAWANLYASAPIDGIFFDEMTNTSNSTHVALYRRYKDYCYGKGFFPVIGNPGANCVPDYFQSPPAADIVVVHETGTWPVENDMKGFSNVNDLPMADSHYEYPTSMRAILMYGQPSLDVFKTRRFGRYVDWIYVTDDVFPTPADNPWDSASSYLGQLYAALADQGGVGRGPTLLTSGTSVAWDAVETDLGQFTIGTNATMAAATNMLPGRTYTLVVTQDGTGSRTLAFNSFYKFPTGTTLPLTGTAGQKHVVEFVFDGTNALATSVQKYS
jgi:hypothetical protein